MKWHCISLGLALALASAEAGVAQPTAWMTDDSLGQNEIVYTVTLGCPNPGFVCDLIDGYVDQDSSEVSGSGSLVLDDGANSFRFETDSSQDVGSGPQPAYGTLSGSDVSFANIPFAGVPEITDLLSFGLSDPNLPAPGLDLLAAGDYPFSQTVSYSGSGTVVGDLEFLLGPEIVVPPDDIVVSGTLRVLGDVDSDGDVDIELRDVTGSFGFQNVTTIAGENVTVDVTADMTLNLSSPVTPVAVPALDGVGTSLLALALLGVGALLLRGARA